jgi:hypothetical protein
MHAPQLEVLVVTAHHLTDAALLALGGLRGLRLLSLAECTASASSLLTALARLAELRVLMLGGGRLHHPMANGHGDGVLSLNRALHDTAPPSTLAAQPDGLCEPPTCGNKLALIEWTFLQTADRELLQRAAPRAHMLDLCAPAAELRAGAERLHAALAGSALTACEGGTCVRESAVAASLSARCAGFHETALHHAAIEGDVEAAELLLDHGAAADVKDAKGCTPLAVRTMPHQPCMKWRAA